MVNEWTSNDVPSVSSLVLHNKRPDLDLGGMQFGAAVAFEAMVEHLNKVHPKPRPVTREDVTQAVRRGHNMLNAEVGVVNEVCDLFGIEAEQAVDPVEELAGQIETATREAIRQVCVDLADVAPSLDPLTVERAMEVTAASRKIAAHILGQEAEQ